MLLIIVLLIVTIVIIIDANYTTASTWLNQAITSTINQQHDIYLPYIYYFLVYLFC